MKKIITTILLFLSITAFSQTTMTVHTSSGASNFLLSDIDSITYNNGSGGGGGNYNIGSIGPSGGIVFYDKGSYSNGWRYMEIAPTNLNDAEWGCYSSSISGTSDAIGTGQANTDLIVAGCSTPGIAAKICNNYSLTNNGTVYDDWFLPSVEELNLLYTAYVQNSLNLDVYLSSYSEWMSSTEEDMDICWFINFDNGDYTINSKNNSWTIRAFRTF